MTSKLRVLELFSGVGSPRMALRNLGIDHEVVAISEIDKFAIKSYEAIHGKTNNLGDVSKLDPYSVPDHDFLIFGFPCQSFSTAGKGLGVEDIRGTLALEAIKIIEAKKPKYIMFENVKGLISNKHKPFLNLVLKLISELGYKVTIDILNAKDYNTPQSRERIYGIGMLVDED